jgi:hypothetical protein
MRKWPKILIIERKLGREKAEGQCFKDDGLIEIDPTLPPKHYLEAVIHEMIHVIYPEATEKEVLKIGKELSNQLWKLKYRRIHH